MIAKLFLDGSKGTRQRARRRGKPLEELKTVLGAYLDTKLAPSSA
jgi:hypothetical protein